MTTDSDGRARTTLMLPDQAGTVTVTASGPGLPNAQFQAQVVAASLEFVTTSLAAGRRTIPYARPLQANGGSGNYSFSVTAGALPGGLTLSSNGSFDGAPSEAGRSPSPFV